MSRPRRSPSPLPRSRQQRRYVVANNKVDAAKAGGPLKLALRKALAAGTIVKAKAAGKFKAGKVEKPKKAKKVKNLKF